MAGPINRVVLIVLDGVGCGALPDADQYGDPGADTLGHVSQKYSALRLPHLARWGAGHLTNMPTVARLPLDQCVASVGRCAELSQGKDTTAGHWEMSGCVVTKAFATFPNGFPKEALERWIDENKLPGVLGNVSASGTEIIERLGEEHMRTGKPILYTSADSVWQVAVHEEKFGLDRLYEICKSARDICDDLKISRVIARPFIGKTATDFKRTHNRKDYSQTPPSKTMMEHVLDAGLPSVGIGKIWNIFNGKGIKDSLETHDNADGMQTLEKALTTYDKGLLFVNLIDFDMLYGHRRDVEGFAKSLEQFDAFIPRLESRLTSSDLVIVSADHGNDPTYRGTDHTREYVPLLAFNPGAKARDLGNRQSFADIGQTVAHALTGKDNRLAVGRSFLPEMR